MFQQEPVNHPVNYNENDGLQSVDMESAAQQSRDHDEGHEADDLLRTDRDVNGGATNGDPTGSSNSNSSGEYSIRFLQRSRFSSIKLKSWIAVVILTVVNLLNYMDRYTIAGVLLEIQNYFSITDTQSGLLTTSFIISYMLLSPLFGYLGDRWNRKLIMSAGIVFWAIMSFASSFVGPQNFYIFLTLRALVGVGEASYSTIAPTIIADLFTDNTRTKALSVFYFAIPVGSGLGYIVGSEVASALGGWQWALRLTPILCLISSLLICTAVYEPSRGASDHSNYLEATPWIQDMKYLFTHKSFLLVSMGFTSVAFVTGSLALWGPQYVYYSILIQPNMADDSSVSTIFGVITVVSGILGVTLGSSVAGLLRRKTLLADPYVCAFGMISSAPFLFLSLYLSRYNTAVTFFCIFMGETLLFLNWALVSDMLLYLVVPTRRSTAASLQILMSHALGDAGSPTLVGLVSDSIKRSFNSPPHDIMVNYQSLQFALYMDCFICVVGGGFFLTASLFINRDRRETQRIMKGYDEISQEDQQQDDDRLLIT